jgi:SOS-response transcriptional repressor LexA
MASHKYNPYATLRFAEHTYYHEYSSGVPLGQQFTPRQSKSFLRKDFDNMTPTKIDCLDRLYARVVTDTDYRARLHNLFHEANADVPAMMRMQAKDRQKHQEILIGVHQICNMLGLANSHDTARKVAEAVLEENQEALQKCLKALAELGCANKTANRERADRPPAKKHHKVSVKIASQIDMVFKEFSNHQFIMVGRPFGRHKIRTYSLQPLSSLPLLSQMITAVTPKAPVSQMQAANVIANETPSADPELLADAAEDSDTELFAELDKGLVSDDSDS